MKYFMVGMLALDLLLFITFPCRAQVIPDDPLYPEQIYYAHNAGRTTLILDSSRPKSREVEVDPKVLLDLPSAWQYTTGSRAVVVAVLDDGFFYWHEDIQDNLWQNPGEVGVDSSGYPRQTNGVDDDGNGHVDDVLGWDFAFEDPDPDPYVFDGMDRNRVQPYSHSIPALGIIGAKGNNHRGIAGINWDVSLMLLKIGAQGVRYKAPDTERAANAARAIRYAVDNGARIINWSGYVSIDDPARLEPLKESIDYARDHNVLLVLAAGNDGVDVDSDENCLYPQCFDLDNMIRVAELGYDGTLIHYKTGSRWRGSNYGVKRVEIGAVAENLTTAFRDGVSTYATRGGTSNAAPVVAGVAALVLSIRPDLTPPALIQLLMDTATPIDALRGKVRSGGSVNAYKAVHRAVHGG
jgi:subtilisin family serine protease